MNKTLLTIIFVACAGFAIAQTVPQQIAALERRINLDNDQIGNDNAEINQYEDQITTLDGQINYLQQDINSQETEITAANSYIQVLDNQANSTNASS